MPRPPACTGARGSGPRFTTATAARVAGALDEGTLTCVFARAITTSTSNCDGLFFFLCFDLELGKYSLNYLVRRSNPYLSCALCFCCICLRLDHRLIPLLSKLS